MYMQFLPVVDGEGKERELITNVMKKVLAENDFSGLDVNKVRSLTYRLIHPVAVLWSFSYGLKVFGVLNFR